MASTNVKLPDGSEQRSEDVICEECDKPVSQHSCVNGGAAAGVAPAAVSRSTGPRKAPASRPPCPHCGGAIHFSMPGGLQNDECIMRQYYLDKGEIPDPYQRLPIWSLDEWARVVDWAKSLKTPLSYGRMESAAGGAGTYAAQRPPAEKRAKKQAAAASGERIEDIAQTVEAPKRPRGRPRKADAVTVTKQPVQVVLPQPSSTPTPTREQRRVRIEGRQAPTQAAPAPSAPPAPPIIDVEAQRAERRRRIDRISAR